MRTIKRDIVGVFIFSADKQLLLGKSQKGGVYKGEWIIPGGGIEEGETKREAAKREIMEEVAIDLNDFELKVLDQVLTGESQKILRDSGEKVRVKMTFYNYVARSEKPASKIAFDCQDDFVDAKWQPISMLSELNLSEPTEVSLKKHNLIP